MPAITHSEMKRTEKRLRFALALLCAAAALLAFTTWADDDTADPNRPEARAARGKVSYRIYCQSCHGKDARGDGPIAELLVVEPADLTQVKKDEGGTFPAERLYTVIDGREAVRGHGNQEMPAWGLTFQEMGRVDGDQEAEVRERILDLVAFIESIQE